MSSARKKILLDANILIKAFPENEADKLNPTIKALRQQIRAWLKDDTVEVCVTPLVRYEVLNVPSHLPTDKLRAMLEQFKTHDINNEVATLAAHLTQDVIQEKERRAIANKEAYSEEQKRTTKLKLRFDVFHVAAADVHGLEVVSHDKDIQLIQQVLQHRSR